HLASAVHGRRALAAAHRALVEQPQPVGAPTDDDLELLAPARDAHLGRRVLDQEREAAPAGLAAVDDVVAAVDAHAPAAVAESLDGDLVLRVADQRREASHAGPRAAR